MGVNTDSKSTKMLWTNFILQYNQLQCIVLMNQREIFCTRKVFKLSNSEFKKLIGKSQFNQSVFYTYNEVNNTFMFLPQQSLE